MSGEQVVDLDQTAYAELEKQFGDTPADTQPAPAEEAKPETVTQEAKKEDAKPDEKKPERSIEEIERNYKNLQGALGESRANERAFKADLEQTKQQLANMQALMQKMRQPEQQQERHPLEPLVAYVKDLGSKVQAFEKETAEQREMRTLTDYAVRGEREFMSKAPDYIEAVNHLASSRMAELTVFMPDNSPQAVDQARMHGFNTVAELRSYVLQQEQQQIARAAKANNLNPAEVLYNFATQRGYRKAEAKTETKPAAKEQIDTIRRGQQEASQSLSGGGGHSAAQDVLSLNDLADLYIKDPAAADQMFNKMKAAGLIG